MLAPRLQAGDIVILDNLSSHKVASIKEAIEKNAGRFSSICRPTVQT
jgi:hypothetical protein